MDQISAAVFISIFLLFVYKSANILWRKVKWQLNLRREASLSGQFKADNTSIRKLSEQQCSTVERLIIREGFIEKRQFEKDRLNPEVYSIKNPDIAHKNWLWSNSYFSASNKVNGLELFIPSSLMFSLANGGDPQELQVVFYDNVALAVCVPGLFDLFQEKEEKPIFLTGINVTKTASESWYEVSAQKSDFSISPDDDAGTIRLSGRSHLFIYPPDSAINGIILISGISGIASLIISAIFFGISGGRLESIAILALWMAFWFIFLFAFYLYERTSFKGGTVVLVDRKRRSFIINNPQRQYPELKWNDTWLRFYNGFGHNTMEIPYAVQESFLFIFDSNDSKEPFFSLPTRSYQEAFSLWKAISCFMQDGAESIEDVIESAPELKWRKVFLLGFNRFIERVRTDYIRKKGFAKLWWAFVTVVTLGPVPFLIAEAIAASKFQQALQQCCDPAISP